MCKGVKVPFFIKNLTAGEFIGLIMSDLYVERPGVACICPKALNAWKVF